MVTIHYQFAYDDALQIVLNPQVTEPGSFLARIRTLFSEPSPPGNLFRPFATLSYVVTHKVVGLSPFTFHATNVALYGFVCALVFSFLLEVTKDRQTTTLATILFVIHPLHTEVVANVIGRAELGSACFVLLACFSASRSVRAQRSMPIAAFAVLTGVCLLIATLWKESSLTACALIPYFAWIIAPKEHGRALRLSRVMPIVSTIVGAALIALVLRRYALGENFTLRPDGKVWPENPLFHLSFVERIVPSLKILGDYLRLLVLPLHQSADYSSMPGYFFERVYSVDGLWSFGVAAAVPLWGLTCREPSTRFFTFWLVVSFALTINLLLPIGTVMGDRLTFLPSVGACALLAIVLQKLSGALRLHYSVVSITLCILYIVLSSSRIAIWESNDVLFAQTILDAPYSPKARYNFGVNSVLKDPQSAVGERAFRSALEIHPAYILPTRAMADIMLARKDYGRLEFWYRRLLDLTPEDETVRKNLTQLEEFKRAPR